MSSNLSADNNSVFKWRRVEGGPIIHRVSSVPHRHTEMLYFEIEDDCFWLCWLRDVIVL